MLELKTSLKSLWNQQISHFYQLQCKKKFIINNNFRGKGLISDEHPNCVGPARSTALGGADVIILAGARLNWILHFGM